MSRNMKLIEQLKILIFFFLLPKIAGSYEQLSISDEHIPLIIDICKFYRAKSVIFLYEESINNMEITTVMFKWTRALSREGFMSTKFYFSELYKSSYYEKKIERPLFVAIISNYNAINEFSLATSNFDMSFGVWLVIFTYSGNNPDYCHNPPFNIFHLRFDSEMIVRCNKENILREWYSIDKNQTEIDEIALWSLENGITTSAPNSLYVRRNNLKGMMMRVVIIKNSPFIKVKKNGKLEGLFGKVFEELCVALNFTFQIVSEVEGYGNWNAKEKKWTGAIGEINTKRADICPAAFTMSNARLNDVDFTIPFLVSKICFFIKERRRFSFKWSSYFLTFSYSIWISIFGVIIIASILLIFLKINTGTDRKLGFLLSDNFLEIWGIFCQQGLADFPDNCSLRIVYFSILILEVVLWAAYSAAFISFLTTANNILPFRSLEEFVNDSTYQLYVFRESIIYDMFLNSNNPLGQKIKKLMVDEKKLSTSSLIAFNTVCKDSKIALYTSESVKNNINSSIECNIVSIPTGYVDNTGMILTKNNPFTDVINFHLQKFMDNGVMHRLKEKSFKMNHINEFELKPVPITTVISLIFFILIGLVLSIFILILEMSIFSRKKMKKLILQIVSYINLQKLDVKN